ncbi:MAG: hypothetical protein C4534_03085 [Gaiellales bacterium]|nr:MAG: hypothetical protein C4534_03085 [Gaiellales bacterium]
MINGGLASVYGAASYICMFLKMNQHDTMKTVCYALGIAGILLAFYWLTTSEVMGLPIFLVGVTHIGLAARSEHVGMQIGCTGLAVVTFVVGIIMLAEVRGTARE